VVSSSRTPAPTIIGRSPGLRRVLESAKAYAGTCEPVLILGETGTGKEGLAKLIHRESGRSGPLVVLDCASLPRDLIEAELFGHERGAFTGAVGERRGLVAEAHGGTVFLDEVGELPLDLQAKLLRVIQEREIRRVGGRKVEKVDVRFVAATKQDLSAMVAAGTFRDDLYFRLSVFKLVLPPLRERGDDLLLLARHIVGGFDTRPGVGARELGRTVGSALGGHHWPGNVRELEGVLLKAAMGGDRRKITGADVRAVLELPPVEVSLQERILAHLANAGEVGMGQITTALRVPRTTAWRELAAMVKAGKLETSGQGKGCRYRLAEGRQEAPASGDPRWLRVLELVEKEGMATRRRVVEVLGLPPRTAGRVLAEMAGAGLVLAEGEGRGLVYRAPVRPRLRSIAGGEGELAPGASSASAA
jgi:transcriptional regulator with GAF, ATPase, and Fis domain